MAIVLNPDGVIPIGPVDHSARFSGILELYAPALRRLCAMYAADGDERDDLMQEVTFALWKALPSFRGECSERTFVFRVANNRALSHRFRRRLPRAPVGAAESLPDPAITPDAMLERASEHERLLNAVRALPVSLRRPVVLRLEGLSDREVSEVLGISEGNVAVRLTRARQALRATLAGHDARKSEPERNSR